MILLNNKTRFIDGGYCGNSAYIQVLRNSFIQVLIHCFIYVLYIIYTYYVHAINTLCVLAYEIEECTSAII
jgi:hypothetical protein